MIQEASKITVSQETTPPLPHGMMTRASLLERETHWSDVKPLGLMRFKRVGMRWNLSSRVGV
jgi:hypothetical protein